MGSRFLSDLREGVEHDPACGAVSDLLGMHLDALDKLGAAQVGLSRPA